MKIESACTSILVGKKASIDGSTMIARNDDTFSPLTPQRFYMHAGWKGEKSLHVKSPLNGFEADLPENGYRYNAVPNVENDKLGDYEESGINERNVAMSATESTYGNERALGFDPLVKEGLDEDLIVNMVLPFIESARHGVEYLGQLIKQYGSRMRLRPIRLRFNKSILTTPTILLGVKAFRSLSKAITSTPTKKAGISATFSAR